MSAADAPPKREFVVLFQTYHHKQEQTFIFYLQWTGNEEALTVLHCAVNKADYKVLLGGDQGGDYCSIDMDIVHRLSEEVVDAHCRIKCVNGYIYHKMFTKCTGKLGSIFTMEDIDAVDAYEMGSLIDSTFYSFKIKEMFSEYRDWYEDLICGKVTRAEYEANT